MALLANIIVVRRCNSINRPDILRRHLKTVLLIFLVLKKAIVNRVLSVNLLIDWYCFQVSF